MPQHNKVCVICNGPFSTYNSAQEVCSHHCRLVKNRQHIFELRRLERIYYKTNCVKCGIEFETNKRTNMTECIGCQLKAREEQGLTMQRGEFF